MHVADDSHPPTHTHTRTHARLPAHLQIITITTDPTAEPSSTLFPVSYPGFPEIVEVCVCVCGVCMCAVCECEGVCV